MYSPLTILRLSEAILYHSTTGVLGLDRSRALKAESQLHQVTSLSGGSGRIEFQLATEDEASLLIILRKTNVKLMKPLCLGIEVNTEWDTTPVTVREAVLARVMGDPTPFNSDTSRWLLTVSKDIELEDFNVALCLRVYDLVKTRLKEMASRSDT